MATQPVAIFDLDGPVNTSAPLTGHDHIRVVAPALRTDEPSRASPALAASAATLTPIGNTRKTRNRAFVRHKRHTKALVVSLGVV
jgi:hypothetical protein